MVCRKTSGSDTSDRSGPECREKTIESVSAAVPRELPAIIITERSTQPSADRKRSRSSSRVVQRVGVASGGQDLLSRCAAECVGRFDARQDAGSVAAAMARRIPTTARQRFLQCRSSTTSSWAPEGIVRPLDPQKCQTTRAGRRGFASAEEFDENTHLRTTGDESLPPPRTEQEGPGPRSR